MRQQKVFIYGSIAASFTAYVELNRTKKDTFYFRYIYPFY